MHVFEQDATQMNHLFSYQPCCAGCWRAQMKHHFTEEALKPDLKQSNVAKCSNLEFRG